MWFRKLPMDISNGQISTAIGISATLPANLGTLEMGVSLSELIVEAQVWLQQARDHLESNREGLIESAVTDLQSRIDRLAESEQMYQTELKAITEAQEEGDCSRAC